MASWTSAESLTKFLRSKDGNIDEIVTTCRNLLENKLEIYLPNKFIFVFQLICDRVNEFTNKLFVHWKYNGEIWKLFVQIWCSLSNDKLVRNRIFKKVKYIEILTSILDNKADDGELIAAVMNATEVVKQDCYLNIDENSTIMLLSSYLRKVAVNNHYSALIKDLYQIPHANVNYTLTKKSYTKFIVNCGQPILSLCLANEKEAIMFKSIFIKLLFNKDMSSHLFSNIKELLPLLSNANEVIYLFELIVDNIKEISQCEQLFLLITSSTKFPGMEENLLEILSKGNKALSYDFFKSIYSKEIEASKVNWNLICYIFELDIELAIENASVLYTHLATSNVDDLTALKVGKTILQAYVKGRELNDFFTSTWTKAIESNSRWADEQFVYIVAEAVDSFSTRQLESLMNDLSALESSKEKLPLFTAILKGLMCSSILKINQIKPIILQSIDYFVGTSDDLFWEPRYYLLCLFEESDWIDKISFKSKHIDNKFYYYFIFRSIELGYGEKLHNLKYQDEFIQYLSRNSSLIEFSLKRWIILIELFFDKKQKGKFVELMFEDLSQTTIKEYLVANGDIFFEQQQLTLSVLDYIAANCKSNNSLIPMICEFPIQNYNKFLRSSILDTLFEVSTNSSSDSINHSSRLAINHLLRQASSKSKIESDFKSIIKLCETCNSSSRSSTFEICQIVWYDHLKQFANEENEKYITDLLKFLKQFFKKYSPAEDIPGALELCLVILSTTEDSQLPNEDIKSKLAELSASFTKAIHTTIDLYIQRPTLDVKKLNWIVWALILTVDRSNSSHKDTLEIIKSLGKAISVAKYNGNINQLRTSIFQLLVKIYPTEFQDSVYVVSLYFALESSYKLSLADDLLLYLSRLALNNDVFIQTFEFVLASTKDLSQDNSMIFMQILTSFINKFKKIEDSELSKLFVRALSIILSKFSLLDFESIRLVLSTIEACLSEKMWLFQQYALETTMVLVTQVAEILKQKSFGSQTSEAPELYIQATRVISSILLFHRYKLSSRHHLIITTFVSLMEPLCLKNHSEVLSSSKDSAAAYSRLLSNLCEVSTKELSKNSLSSTSSLIKKAMRKHLPVLLINYIYYSLKFNFQSIVQEELTIGVYSILDVLSQIELQLVSSSLDIPGRSYYRTLYSTYKDHGKWKDV